MPTFKSLNDLMRYVNKATADSMPEVGKELEEVFKEAIDKEVYKAYSPEIYERTGQLKDMVETTRIGNENVEAFLYMKMIHIICSSKRLENYSARIFGKNLKTVYLF